MHSYSTRGTYTDLYQLAMAQAYFKSGRADEPACFDYFFRKMPFRGGFVIFAGLQDLIDALDEYRFTDDDLNYLEQNGFQTDFLSFLQKFKFRGTIFSCREGEVVFSGAPLVRVEGNIMESQLIETLLLNILNFQTLIATKAARIDLVAQGRTISEFGMRRAQGPASVPAARAAVIGGASATSNVFAAQLYDLSSAGTMAHSFIQSFETELEAFRSFAAADPKRCIFLVDTYNTLKSGVVNAITVAHEMEQRGERAIGIRLDSGDLAFLAKSARKMLDEAGLNYMKIVASNQLDEYVVKSLVDQQAPIDVFGVGTNLVTGNPDAALDGVYKLSVSNGRPKMKISENIQKMTLPGKKQVVRTFDDEGNFYGADAVMLYGENACSRMFHPIMQNKSLEIGNLDQQPLLHMVIRNGELIMDRFSLSQIAAFAKQRLKLLPETFKRFEFPHQYKVGLSENLLLLRESVRNSYKNLL